MTCSLCTFPPVSSAHPVFDDLKAIGHLGFSRVDPLPAKATGRPSANAAVMWRYFTTSVYQSGDLPLLATREALQNSVDAIRAAIRKRQIPHGHFEVTWDPERRALTWEDNGIGMDTTLILEKFLVIGESGKGDAGDSGEAAGGFGVAKAVILGASSTFRWELHTQDNLAVGKGAAADVEIFDATRRQGTRITIFDVSPDFEQQYDYARRAWIPMAERLKEMLGANDLPGISLRFNGQEVGPLFSRRGGSPVKVEVNWGTGTKAWVKAYRRPPGDKGGAYYIRLNGLFQFKRSSGAGLKVDVVIDLHSSIRPGQAGYPLNAARDALQDRAEWAFAEIREEVERENESTGRSEETEEVYDPDSDDESEAAAELGEMTAAAFADPALQEALENAAGGILDFYAERYGEPSVEAEVTSVAPRGSRRGPPEEEEGPRKHPIPAGFVRPETKIAPDLTAQLTRFLEGVAEVARQNEEGGPMTAAVKAAIQEVETGEATAGTMQVIEEAIEKATEMAMKPGGGGLMQAAVVPEIRQKLETATGQRLQRRNPFGKAAGLWISKKNYDRQKAYRFKKNYGRWMPHLVVWDSTLRLLATEARIRRKFKPGFVLDDKVLGLTSRGPRGSVIYLHPDKFMQVVRAHRDRPMAIAGYLHGVACHELTHLDAGRLHANGHDERFVVAREDLGVSTAHLLPAIAVLAQKLLQLPQPEQLRLDQMQKDLETAKQQSQALRVKLRATEKESQRLKRQVDELQSGIQSTPGTPYRWSTLGEWLTVLQTLRSRKGSAPRQEVHWGALPGSMVAGASLTELSTLESLLPEAPAADRSRLHPAITQARQRCGGNRSERLLNQVERLLRASPPTGVSPAYVDGFLRRNRARMMTILERTVGR